MSKLRAVRCFKCGMALPATDAMCPRCFPLLGSPVVMRRPVLGSREALPVTPQVPDNRGGVGVTASPMTTGSVAGAVKVGFLVALGVIVPVLLGLRPRRA
jgi:hypothetical protein